VIDLKKRIFSAALAAALVFGCAGVNPPRVWAASPDFVAVAAGASHSLALEADGSLWTWGNSNNG
jgi:hypothetical protein